jgi:hypothetical protein
VWQRTGLGDPGKAFEIQETRDLKAPRYGVLTDLPGEEPGWGGPSSLVESSHPQSSGSGSLMS